MKSPSLFKYYRGPFSHKNPLLNRKTRFILMLVSLAAVFSMTFTFLTFAQKRQKEKLLQAEPTVRRSEVEQPRRSAPERRDAKGKRLRSTEQDQDLKAQSREDRGERERGERRPRMLASSSTSFTLTFAKPKMSECA